jgi:flagellar protein FlgJ
MRSAEAGRPLAAGPAAHAASQTAKLRKAAHDLEGIFVNELFKAMRETVPQDGILSQDPGQDLFTGMLDERLAERYAERSQGGLGEALYRQLSRRLPDPGPG